MKLFQSWIFPIFFMVLTGSLSPVFSREWTPDELLALIPEHNLDLAAEGAMVDSQNSQVGAAQGDFMPLKVSYSLMDLENPLLGDLGKASQKLSLIQDIPWTGRTFFQGQVAQNSAQSKFQEWEWMKRQKILQLQSALVNYAAQKKMLGNLEGERSLLDQLTQIARSQYTTGKITFTAMTSLEIKASDLAVETLSTELALSQILLEIQELVNLDDPEFSLKLPSLKAPAQGWPSVDGLTIKAWVASSNPQLAAQEKLLEVSRGNLNLERSLSLPDAGLMVEFLYQGMDQQMKYTLGLEIGLPVLGTLGTISRIQSAEKEVQSQDLATQRIRISFGKRTESLVLTHGSLVAQLELLDERGLKAGEENLVHMIQEYQTQGSDFSSVVDAVFTTYELKNRQAAFLAQIFTIYYELEALSGQQLLKRSGE